MSKDLVKSVWYITSSHAMFVELMNGWKSKMSTPGSKVIAGRIQWSEETGKLPLLVLGVSGDKVRYAVHGGSEDIRRAELVMFTPSDDMVSLGHINNDEVQAWRAGIKEVVKVNIEKPEVKAAGRLSKTKDVGHVLSGALNNAGLMGLAQSVMKNAF